MPIRPALAGLVFVVLLLTGPAPAQDPPTDAHAAEAEAADPLEPEHEKLRELKAVAEEAINTNNLELLRPHMDEQFSVVTFTNRLFTDFDVFQREWQKSREKFLEGGAYEVEMLPERSRIEGDVAITMGDSKNVLVKGNGKRFEFSSHWSAVCRNVNGDWKIARVHSSMDPFNNPMVVAGAKKEVMKYGVAALAIGLVIGWSVRWLMERRAAPSSPG